MGGRIAIFGCWSLSQSFSGTFFELVIVENLRIAVGLLTLSMIVPEKVLLVWAAILLFSFVCRTLFELIMVENPRVQLETNKFVVLLVGAFFPKRDLKRDLKRKIEAQYEG